MAMAEVSPGGVLQLIKSRRSIARMKPDPVDRSILEQSLDAAVWVPNHRLTEPWQFFVLQGSAKGRFAEVRRDFRRSTMPNPDAPEVQPALQRLYADTMQTPAIIIVTVLLAEDAETREEDFWATFAAAYVVMLGLWGFGVGSFWRTGPLRDYPPLREWLGLPAERRITGVLYVGYPAEVPQKRRTPAAERTVWLE